MNLRLILTFLLLWSGLICGASAQITVSLAVPRTMFLVDEALPATLKITNLAGRDITLEDNSKDGPWCLFQIKAVRGTYVPSRKPNLTFPPLSIPAGGSISRSLDLAELYDLNEPGQYRIRACVSFAPTHSQFWTEPALVSTDSGRLLWNQTVGVPDGRPGEGAYRTFSVLTQQRQDGMFLYAKLEGKQEGIRYPCYPLGRILAAMQPQQQIDKDNNLVVFHASNDSSYTLSQIDVASGRLQQSLYKSAIPNRQGRPSLRRGPEGALVITGGIRVTEDEIAGESAPGKARLSERPAGF